MDRKPKYTEIDNVYKIIDPMCALSCENNTHMLFAPSAYKPSFSWHELFCDCKEYSQY